MKRPGLVMMILVRFATASAATITVSSGIDNATAGDGQCTLREAIANVNAAADTTAGDCAPGSGSGDSVTFAPAVSDIIRLSPALGEIVITQNVTITGPTSGALRLDGRHATRIFNIASGITSISNLTIQHGQLSSGGGGAGLCVGLGASLNLTNCTVRDNKGGVPYADGGAIANSGTLTLTNCTLFRNRAGRGGSGGGLSNFGTAALTNCTLSDNRAQILCLRYPDGERGCDLGSGGAIDNFYGTVTLTNCTLTRNRAPKHTMSNSMGGGGGGIINGGTVRVINTVLAQNYPDNCLGAVSSAGHNLTTDETCFSSGGSDLVRPLARLGRPGNYGGPTQTIPLCTAAGVPDASCRDASPAIDAGDDAVTAPPLALTTDQRGLTRQAGSHVDIGAYEVH